MLFFLIQFNFPIITIVHAWYKVFILNSSTPPFHLKSTQANETPTPSERERDASGLRHLPYIFFFFFFLRTMWRTHLFGLKRLRVLVIFRVLVWSFFSPGNAMTSQTFSEIILKSFLMKKNCWVWDSNCGHPEHEAEINPCYHCAPLLLKTLIEN